MDMRRACRSLSHLRQGQTRPAYRSGGYVALPDLDLKPEEPAMSLEKIVWVIIIVAYFIKGWNDD